MPKALTTETANLSFWFWGFFCGRVRGGGRATFGLWRVLRFRGEVGRFLSEVRTGRGFEKGAFSRRFLLLLYLVGKRTQVI